MGRHSRSGNPHRGKSDSRRRRFSAQYWSLERRALYL